MKKFTLILISIAAAITLLTFSPEMAQSQSSEQKTHTVEVRETLFSISRKYNITVQNIRDWNNLESDVVPPGTVLFVSEPRVQAPRPTTGTQPVTQPSTQTPQTTIPVPPRTTEPVIHSKPEIEEKNLTEIIHVVARGETLFSIARMYRTDLNQLRTWNNLPSDAIQLNQRLIVGYDTTYTSTVMVDAGTLIDRTAELSATSDQPRPTAVSEDERLRMDEELTSATYYTVRSGDTLSSISRRFGISLTDLRTWNNIRGDVISIGQELIVGRTAGARVLTGLVDESTAQGRFLEYEMKRNDSIYRILLNHQMDETDFIALNSGLTPSDVRPGMKVMLLAPPTVSHSNPYRIQRGAPTSASTNQSGSTSENAITAGRYSDSERGQTTTSGDLYNPEHLTAAHQTLRLGSVVHVVNPVNNKGVFVLINDRITDGSIKLSGRAFDFLGLDASNPRVEINTNVN